MKEYLYSIICHSPESPWYHTRQCSEHRRHHSSDVATAALRAHDAVRNAVPLAWDETLAKESLEQAQKITEDASCEVSTVDAWDMDRNAPHGRNTFAIHGIGCDWVSVVRSWSAETIDPDNLDTGANKFQTQGVAVEKIGCAQVSSGDCHAFVCQYSPRQTVVSHENYQNALAGPEIPCPGTCGGVLPCRNTEI